MVVVKTYTVEVVAPIVQKHKVSSNKDTACLHFVCTSGTVTVELHKGNFDELSYASKFKTITLTADTSAVIDVFHLCTEYYWYVITGSGTVQLAVR